MDPSAGSDSNPPERKGSVRRAREMLEAGRRPKIQVPQANAGGIPPSRRDARQTQWPLPDDNMLQTNVVDQKGTPLISKSPPPQRPPRPDLPSPSIYSVRSASDAAPSPLHINHPKPSFSHPFHNQLLIHPALRDPAPVTSEDTPRKPGVSSVDSIQSLPDLPQPIPPRKPGNLAPQAAARAIMNHPASVSPIPEELLDSPTIINKPYAPSRTTRSSWSSEKGESAILGAYADGDSGGAHEFTHAIEGHNGNIIRQASLGKRGKPSLRTISKPCVDSPPLPKSESKTVSPRELATGAALKEVAAGVNPRNSLSSDSSEESHFDPEKPPIVLVEDPRPHQGYRNRAFAKEVGALPKGAPTMSEIRPGARRPPRLNMAAVRDAEARGSLTSLSDLIKRATKLASNLEHNRTASRNDLLNAGGGSRFAFRGDHSSRSGSIKDILASFPPPAATPEGHSSWPVFFQRSTLHQLNSQEQGPEEGQEKGTNRQRRCCGLPLWAFILICIILILVIAAAVLIPIFLVVVPREHQNSASSGSTCEKTAPCENGGVSVSSGNVCSCVCANGYTGSRCTTVGDASCVTTEITQGSTSRNATMGDDLPRLFEDSKTNFSIPLDPITIMALLSQNNVSCTTENALVSFSGMTSSNSTRRSLSLDEVLVPDGEPSDDNGPPGPAPIHTPTPTLTARNSIATENGIVFDNSSVTETSQSVETTPSSVATPKSTSTTSSSLTITTKVLDFSRIAVLYILEKTGTLEAAMFSADAIQTYLEKSYSHSSNGIYHLNLVPAGVKGNFTLDFQDLTITNLNGDVIGG
ncbi:hypothetical protein ARAM_000402 [Aspergillus rambellii]|uniref:EGF-like domain-containing protein n=1 Tax=Aspergillus rambellii TaxID=308745 RepID=A0A0F8WF33_9EURO|nr:hypothetical protein ARAM_000402 [Aspergillus rambellii]